MSDEWPGTPVQSAGPPAEQWPGTPVSGDTTSIGAQAADAAGETAKGLPRGVGNFLGTMGEAVMGPFGRDAQSREAMANAPEPTPQDIEKYGSRYGYFQSKTKPTYGQDIAHAAGIEAHPTTTAGKFAAPISEAIGNPASYIGPGGPVAKVIAAAGSGAGGEGARELAEGSGYEGPAELIGSVLGGYLPGKAVSVGQNVSRSRNVQTTEQLHQAATADYDAARALGVEYQPQRVEQLHANIESDLLHQGHRDDKAAGTFRRIDELTDIPNRTASMPSYSDIESIRKTLNEVRQEVHPHTGRPTEDARAAGIAIHHIDDFLADPRNALPIHQGQSLQNTGIAIAGNPNSPAAQTARLSESARGNWSAMVSSQELERALQRGELGAASAGSGSNIDNTLRQQIKNILNNPRRAAGFSADERAIMRDIVMGNPVRNSARLLGKMAATGIVSAAGTEFLAHTMGLGAVGHAALPIAGYAAKKSGDYMTRARINRLLEAVRMDSPAGRANPVGPRTMGAPYALRAALTSPFGNSLGNPYSPQ